MAKRCTGCGMLDSQLLGLNSNGEPYLACCPDNNYKEITAVEWLENKVNNMIKNGGDLGEDYPALLKHIERAKQMEKEQILNARLDGFKISGEGFNGEYPYEGRSDDSISNSINNEQYYNETYNK